MFAQTECIVDESTLTDSNIDCYLNDAAVCGDWLPELYSKLGLVLINDSVEKLTVNCQLAEVSPIIPNTEINVLGGDNITFSGTGFPRSLIDSTVRINFNNEQQTACVPVHTSNNEIICETAPFDKVQGLSLSLEASLTIND